VRDDLRLADIILPSLNAASHFTFIKIDRPGTVEELHPASISELRCVAKFWNLNNVEIIASVPERKDIKSYRQDTESAIFETIVRRPCTVNDLAKILGTHASEINKYLGVLENENKIETVRQERGVFYRIKKA